MRIGANIDEILQMIEIPENNKHAFDDIAYLLTALDAERRYALGTDATPSPLTDTNTLRQTLLLMQAERGTPQNPDPYYIISLYIDSN